VNRQGAVVAAEALGGGHGTTVVVAGHVAGAEREKCGRGAQIGIEPGEVSSARLD
jgi:hypothetical protein